MNEIEFMINRFMKKRDIENPNCPFGHILNSAHKKSAFDIGEKGCHSGNTQKFQNCCLCR